MVTKSKAGPQKGKVKVSKLKLNKETVKSLTDKDAKKVKGGLGTCYKPETCAVNRLSVGFTVCNCAVG